MAETTAAYEKGKLYDLPITELKPDPNQPRKSMDPEALEELTASVRTYGIIQPILFRVDGGTPSGQVAGESPEGIAEAGTPYGGPGTLCIVAGERRFAAARQCGLATVPGVCVEGNSAEIALVENLLRQDLTAVEEAEALQRLKEEQKYTDEQLSDVIGKSKATISESLSLNKLPQTIRDACRQDPTVPKNVLVEIARKKQVRGMQTAYEKYQEKAKKAVEGRTKQEKGPETAADVAAWLGKAVAKLRDLDTTAWTEEEKAPFNQTLTDLQAAIQELLNPPAPNKDLA